MFSFLQTWQAHLKSPSETKGKQSFYGPAEGQAVHVILEAVAQALGFANNEVMNPAFVNNKVLSATSDSSIYVTGIVNQSVTGQNCNVWKERTRIPIFKRIRPELQCLKEKGKNSNVWKDNVRIPTFGRRGSDF